MAQRITAAHVPDRELAPRTTLRLLDNDDWESVTAKPITCTFTLDDEDLKAVADVLGPDVLKGRSYSRSIPYEEGHTFTSDVDEGAALENLYLHDDVQAVVETLTAEIKVTQPRELADCAKVFAGLAEMAVYGDAARSLIRAAIDALE